jgi:hypothetical protein
MMPADLVERVVEACRWEGGGGETGRERFLAAALSVARGIESTSGSGGLSNSYGVS